VQPAFSDDVAVTLDIARDAVEFKSDATYGFVADDIGKLSNPLEIEVACTRRLAFCLCEARVACRSGWEHR